MSGSQFRTTVAAMLIAASAPTLVDAQPRHNGGSAPQGLQAPKEATQYDFLIGQWELTVKPKAMTLGQKIHGTPKLRGTWKGWRAMEGWGVEDDLRIVDASGNPVALTHFTRLYDATEKKWVVAAADVYRGRIVLSNPIFANGEFQSTSSSTDAAGKPVMTRSRLSKITATSFHFEQDRSEDGGKSWTEGMLVIDAKRTAATAPR